MIPISRRLQAIAALVDQPVIADIGCDHAYVCVDALLHNRCVKAYACDAAKGPLANAEKSAKTYGLQKQMLCRLQNGIEALPEDTQQIVIAGMGGRLMISILSQAPIPQRVSSLLLSPHKDADVLRLWLIEHGFDIEMEQWVEDGLYYPILKVIPSSHAKALSEQEMLLGRNPLQDLTYRSMLSFLANKWQNIARKIPEEKRADMERKISLACSALEEAGNSSCRMVPRADSAVNV